MPYLAGRYIDEDEYYDLLQDAREEEYYDRIAESGWTCSNTDCRRVWDPGYVPASRLQPAEIAYDSCPRCGSEPLDDEHGSTLCGEQDDDYLEFRYAQLEREHADQHLAS